jgi:signal peptidase
VFLNLTRNNQNGVSVFGYSGFGVLTGSMEPYVYKGGHPTIHQGDLVIVKDAHTFNTDGTPVEDADGNVISSISPEDIQVGDVITFLPPDGLSLGELVTHRVVAVNNTGDTYTFTTQGDANNAPDQSPVDFSLVRGKVVFVIPMLGKVLSFFQNRTVWIVLPITFLVIIIVLEVVKSAVKRSRQLPPASGGQ